MLDDDVLSGARGAGPPAGFHPAGRIARAAGIAVGAIDLVAQKVPGRSAPEIGIPCPPMSALMVAFVRYVVMAGMGLQGGSRERPIFGKIRYMSSRNTARKLRVREYLAKYGP